MGRPIPKVLSDALADETWRDPGPDGMRALLGQDLDLDDLELFKDVETMRRVTDELDHYGKIDHPEFCMVRDADGLCGPDDKRLVFQSTLFVGGSVIPGDDVFVALDLRGDPDDPGVLVLDWRKSAPDRWVRVGPLSDLVAGLAKLAAN